MATILALRGMRAVYAATCEDCDQGKSGSDEGAVHPPHGGAVNRPYELTLAYELALVVVATIATIAGVALGAVTCSRGHLTLSFTVRGVAHI